MGRTNHRNNKRRAEKKISYQTRRKLVGLYVGVLLALVCLVVRITFINATNGDKYKKQVLSQAQQKYESRVLPAKRGDIYDRNGNLLATSNKVYNVILDCMQVNTVIVSGGEEKTPYVEPTIRALTEVLGLDEKDVRARLTNPETQNSQYQILKRQLSMDEKKEFEAYLTISDEMTDGEKQDRRNVKGIWFEEDYLRIYPFNELACDTIGFTFARDVADWGIEGYYNSTLMGTDGRQYGYFNSDADVEQTIIEPTNGKSVETTIDVGIQQIVEKYVNGFKEAMGAKNIGVIIEDPKTGEILAMDGGDRYDLNEPRDMSMVHTKEEIKEMNDAEMVDALNSMWSNFCITDAFEPGSTVKPIVVASALEKGKIATVDTFLCDGGEAFGANGDPFIKCAAYPESHGTETLAEVIANSCNDGMMKIADSMGAEQFIRAQSQFNFGSRTGIDLPNEGTGIIHTEDTMGETELACSAFGQGFTCTMIQEINAMCAAINGGYYYQPHLVTKIKDSNGGVIKSITPTLLKQTISSNISSDIREYMRASVENGTSRYTKIGGYSSGGKTGTAEKLPRGNGKYLVSFVGFAPVEDPQLVIYVVVDEPNAEEQADSKFAQYIAQGILSELLPYMNILPDEISSDGYIPETELWTGFEGKLQDISGGSVDEDGNLVDGEGNLIDLDGNRIDPDGYLLDKEGNYLVDDNGYWVKSPALKRASDELPEAVSDPSVPAPPEDDFDPIQGNDMQSEGITNEEAGLE